LKYHFLTSVLVFSPKDNATWYKKYWWSLNFGCQNSRQITLYHQAKDYSAIFSMLVPPCYAYVVLCSLYVSTSADCVEEGQSPPEYVFEGAKALLYHLRSWTQRKDVCIHCCWEQTCVGTLTWTCLLGRLLYSTTKKKVYTFISLFSCNLFHKTIEPHSFHEFFNSPPF